MEYTKPWQAAKPIHVEVLNTTHENIVIKEHNIEIEEHHNCKLCIVC